MEEVGVPMTDQVPKQLKPEMVERATLIVAMGRGISAEGAPEKFLITENWDIEDPAGQTFGDVRKIRDAIEEKSRGDDRHFESRQAWLGPSLAS